MRHPRHLLALAAGTLCGSGLLFTTFTMAAADGPRYVAHEWGTFTSVQGADGVPLAWNPLVTSDLPGFVHDWPKSGPEGERATRLLIGGKQVAMTLQRMETPVIYFYADDPMRVNATVTFPLGTMTEWYPKAVLGDGRNKEAQLLAGPKTLEWRGVEVLPAARPGAVSAAPGVAPFPVEPGASHYYAARETDADPIRVGTETEKFLFYRGVGSFRAPLTVTQSGDDAEDLVLANTDTAEALGPLFVYQSTAEGARFVAITPLKPGERRELKLSAAGPRRGAGAVRAELVPALERALAGEGLYEREAKAMVKTWDDAWLGERGVRVLYALPAAWTDRVLPLALEPKPAQVVRVMVGRAELITPRMEWDLLREIVRYGGGVPEEQARAVSSARALELGRFLEPTVRRLTSRLPSRTFAEHSAALMQAVAAASRHPQGQVLAPPAKSAPPRSAARSQAGLVEGSLARR